MKNKRIYIIGFMGAGKSSAGRRLANTMKIKYIDLDTAIEKQVGKTIPDIFADDGHDKFREFEAMALRSVTCDDECVISTGGGTPCFCDNMQYMLDSGTVVYLSMTPGMLKSRLEKSKKERPLLKNLNPDELLNYVSDTLEQRKKWYEKANIIVDGSNIDFELLKLILK